VTEPDLVGLFVDPRFTRDIDLIVELREQDARRLLEAFSPEDFYRPPGSRDGGGQTPSAG
jgi:hypothetical protein